MPNPDRTAIEAQLAQAVALIDVLRVAVEHYADVKQWDCLYAYEAEESERENDDWYVGGIHGYTVAQEALARYEAVLDAHVNAAAKAHKEETIC